jgi:hypothetical protein
MNAMMQKYRSKSILRWRIRRMCRRIMYALLDSIPVCIGIIIALFYIAGFVIGGALILMDWMWYN